MKATLLTLIVGCLAASSSLALAIPTNPAPRTALDIAVTPPHRAALDIPVSPPPRAA